MDRATATVLTALLVGIVLLAGAVLKGRETAVTEPLPQLVPTNFSEGYIALMTWTHGDYYTIYRIDFKQGTFIAYYTTDTPSTLFMNKSGSYTFCDEHTCYSIDGSIFSERFRAITDYMLSIRSKFSGASLTKHYNTYTGTYEREGYTYTITVIDYIHQTLIAIQQDRGPVKMYRTVMLIG
ncbi:hypothetical protein [Pyrococcus kukulkanii]|uniref:hypothetical protein n=1 Tax=Pyrococcus kukulkanii TaxID=1609559 RepID=UPI003566A74D